MIPCLDLLLLPKYRKAAVRAFPRGFGVGAFSSVVSRTEKTIECIEEILNLKDKRGRPKCVAARINLMWKDGHHSNDPFTRRDFPAIEREAEKWLPTVEKFPHVPWYFSGATEHKLGFEPASELCERVLKILPQVVYVNNPMPEGSFLSECPNVANEVHGRHAVQTGEVSIFSFDGDSCDAKSTAEMRKRFKRVDLFFLWHARFNGKKSDTDRTKRERRTDWADAAFIRKIASYYR